jgi:hypothetical protein
MRISVKQALFTVLLCFQSGLLYAFELATEGTMSSVVITAANSADELKRAASTPDGYVDHRYELMPFKTKASVSVDDLDPVAEMIEYAQVQEVTKQQKEGRLAAETGLLADSIRSYLPPSVTRTLESGATEVLDGFDAVKAVGKRAVDVVFGQLEQSFELISSSMHSISHETTRFLESFTASNVSINPDHGSIGSFHVTDMQTTTRMTIAEHE